MYRTKLLFDHTFITIIANDIRRSKNIQKDINLVENLEFSVGHINETPGKRNVS